ncbi:MAG: restriction endonuclease subunit S [Patescibacteria group bacterium]
MTYPTKKLGEVLDYEQPTKYIVKTKHYNKDYQTPVLTAGKTFVLGNTAEKDNIFPSERLPVIIFDDFTTATKFVTFQFKVKSSAMKILHPKEGIADPKYFYLLLQTLHVNHATHKRYWISEYSNLEVKVPPLVEQKKIVAKIEQQFAKIDETSRLRAESARLAAQLLPAALHGVFEEGEEKGWQKIKLEDALDYEQPGKYIVRSKNYIDSFKTPVLTAGKTFILGNTNETENIFPKEKLPVIIFDDFTTAIQYVDFPFKVKSSAMKILHAKREVADTRYLFYLMQTINLDHSSHKRYWISQYSKLDIPLPSLVEQKMIVEKLDALSEKSRALQELQAKQAADFTALKRGILREEFESE